MMPETPTPDTTADKKEMARKLYLHTSLTQSEIAEIIGTSQKTVSGYISENKLALIKKKAEQSPMMYLDQMHDELQELNNAIASRPPGKRFATKVEAEIRRKTLFAMAALQRRQASATHMEVLHNFLLYVTRINREDARLILKYTDEYIIGQMDTVKYDLPPLYSLPAEKETSPKLKRPQTGNQ